MENFQGIHASVITALRCSKTRVWNSAGPQIFSRTPELHTRNSAGLRTLDWNAITWQNSRPGIPPDSRTLIPESAGLQNSEPGIHRNPEFRVSVTWNSGGLRPESKPDLEFRWNSAGIPGLFLLGLPRAPHILVSCTSMNQKNSFWFWKTKRNKTNMQHL